MRALVTNIQGYSIHDGPGIRTVVFFKGCALSCRWCANPECISNAVQIGFIENLCTGCGKCLSVCPAGAVNTSGAGHRIDYSLCTSCGACADNCYYGAMNRYGSEMTVPEVFDAVRRDKMFYGDDGGVTVSGGEPLLQPEFVKELFTLCLEDNISTCIETSGFAAAENLRLLLPYTDYLLFDIKHLSSDKHREYTKQPNELILENARLAAQHGKDVLFRMPLIPSVNDDEDNIGTTAAFLKSIIENPKLQLMPYHRLGESKYKALGLENTLSGLSALKPEEAEHVRLRFEEHGIITTISK